MLKGRQENMHTHMHIHMHVHAHTHTHTSSQPPSAIANDKQPDRPKLAFVGEWGLCRKM